MRPGGKGFGLIRKGKVMFFTGFADEAARGIEGQISATLELGWSHIESRNVGGKNIVEISEDDFSQVRRLLDESGVKINCFGSEVANWGVKIADDFSPTVDKAKRAIERMGILGTKAIRIMSFGILQGVGVDSQMAEERFRRLRELKKMFDGAGVTAYHENCMNYGGMGWKYTLELIENVPGLELVFDTGNPVFTPDFAKGEPYVRQSAWEFYTHVKDHIGYVHIKDGKFVRDVEGAIFPEASFCFPGEGDGDVRRILKDLLGSGYDGGISIEPHLSVVYHESSKDSAEELKRNNYIEYGRRLEQMVGEIRAELALEK